MAARTRLTGIAVALTATWAATPPAGAITVGVQSWQLPTAAGMTTARSGGVTAHRVVFDWSTIGKERGRPDWSGYDSVMTAAAAARVDVLPVLLGCAPHVCQRRLAPPVTTTRRRAWAQFAATVARRYGRGGSFWTAHPELAARPLRAYQLWNEPNLIAFWDGRPDAREYLRLAAASGAAIKAVDANATIVLAGLAESRRGVPVTAYLAQLYALPGARSAFDVAAVHPYARTSAAAIDGVRRFRAVMNARGDRRTPIWVTEVGWATGGPQSPFRVGRTRQASLVGALLRALRGRPAGDRVHAVYLFSLQDRRLRADEADWFAPHTGLFDVAGRPKPSWRALTAFTGVAASAARLPPAPR